MVIVVVRRWARGHTDMFVVVLEHCGRKYLSLVKIRVFYVN